MKYFIKFNLFLCFCGLAFTYYAAANDKIIPEPGYLMYGRIIYSQDAAGAPITWNVEGYTFNCEIKEINGKSYYSTVIPFETRIDSTALNFNTTTKAFGLKATENEKEVEYSRVPNSTAGINVSIIFNSKGRENIDKFIMRSALRGSAERVDLAAGLNPDFNKDNRDFEDWATRNFGRSVLPGDDTNNDGRSNWDEFLDQLEESGQNEYEDLVIKFNEGWNLFSFNRRLQDTSVEAILGATVANVDQVLGLRGVWSPGATLNSLKQLQHGSAYWLKAKNSFELEIAGDPIEPQSIRLRGGRGWNQVGITYPEDIGIVEATSFIRPYIKRIEAPGDIVYDFDNPIDRKTTIFKPGLGYFMKLEGIDSIEWVIGSANPSQNDLKPTFTMESDGITIYPNIPSTLVLEKILAQTGSHEQLILLGCSDGELRGLQFLNTEDRERGASLVLQNKSETETYEIWLSDGESLYSADDTFLLTSGAAQNVKKIEFSKEWSYSPKVNFTLSGDGIVGVSWVGTKDLNYILEKSTEVDKTNWQVLKTFEQIGGQTGEIRRFNYYDNETSSGGSSYFYRVKAMPWIPSGSRSSTTESNSAK